MPARIATIRFSLRTKLLLVFVVVVALASTAGGVSTLRMNATNDLFTKRMAAQDDAAFQAAMLDAAFQGQQQELTGLLLHGSARGAQADFDRYTASFDAAGKAIAQQRSELAATLAELKDTAGQATLAKFDTDYAAYTGAYAQASKLFDRANGFDVAAVSTTLGSKDAAAEADLGALADSESNAAEASKAAAVSQARATVVVASSLFVVAGIVSTLLVLYLAQGIRTNVNRVKTAARHIAAGDLKQQVDVHSTDEIGEMADAFRDMTAYLSRMATAATEIAHGDLTIEVVPASPDDALGHAFVAMIDQLNSTLAQTADTADSLNEQRAQLAQAADQAAQATQEVARASQQVAAGTMQQAEGTQRINQGIVELGTSIGQVAAGAQTQAQAVQEATVLSSRVAGAADQVAAGAESAAVGAREAAATAGEGATLVQRTVDGMARIQQTVAHASDEVTQLGERSVEIGKIISVIQDIAAQTNLLALNAAIEAARAGEQGRGFAVVADEVRQLAERVARSTREIDDLINGLQRGVDASIRAMEEGSTEVSHGAVAAGEAGAALQRILAAAASVSEQIARIADGSQDLRTSGREMAALIAEFRGVADQNSTAADEMRSAVDGAADQVSTIAAVSEENSAATEQLSASAEEMTAQVEELTASTHTLGAMAQDLRDQVAAFHLRGTAPVDIQSARARAA